MKRTSTLLLTFLALAAASQLATAQDAPGGRPGAGGPGGRPAPPLLAALDTNKDGEIDATEMASAVAALKTLDKNGDGKLSGDEIHPAHGQGGPGGGKHGPGGPGGPR